MKVNKRGIVAAGAIAIVSTLTLAGCSTGTSSDDTSGSDDSGKLVVWVDAERVDALQSAADAYQDKTGVKVELTGKSVDDMKDDFIQQVPTGKGPDIVMGAHDWLGELSTNGVVAPIELGDSSEDYLPVALQAATYEGTVYMLPYAVENIAVLRNADLVPTAATSFDDMVAKGTFVVEQGAEGNPYHLYPFQTAFGAPVFGTDDTGSYDPTDLQLGSEGGFAFADWLGAQGAAGVLNTDVDGEIAKQQFLDGTAAFWLTGPWNVGAATDAGINVAIDPIPSPTGETASPFAGVKGFFVSSESKNKVAANDFLVNYIGTEDVQLELFKAGNILPALTAAADTAAADPIIAGFQAVGADAVPMPAIPAMGAVWQYWGVAEAAIINGEDPATTWQKLVDDVTAAIK
ncbi:MULTISPECIES: extracellular solute-binding protein [unclassified Microbacterium]|jgi:arabinogalactan oligomer/maltooligosaccharide transport system substrate-binding protein|uniref:sugar ABC transporter substrate-binding protein n=1 Tax=unclassified Microbacterium TaxID=2609290 RepID=UPI000CFDAAB2|nr:MULTISPECIES: extracellular solute-binding protein [unclassified Microbacterium]PQZ59120.1 maltose ABC transporter substrate-binding protein [Microbacterium sp. MYb43]PQZ81212.1 maltose ABC transporter substrate-binding protein [Microbacterium sp. MYb40]PRB21784.1 maltose ABC transporter substrate-binding protein [Microbacterium sp. MYb54]PRB31543.1 maltose ABC transporter substrate-binding protein [Microbacterium sp. MYb50]PRB68421.1 maltose ABC transporter substrate-binding protein [Micro